MWNVDCPSSFPQLRKANQGFNPITSLSPHLLVLSQTLWEGIVNSVQHDHPLSRQLSRTIFMEAVLYEHVELVSEALLEKVAEAICEKLKRQIGTKKIQNFLHKI